MARPLRTSPLSVARRRADHVRERMVIAMRMETTTTFWGAIGAIGAMAFGGGCGSEEPEPADEEPADVQFDCDSMDGTVGLLFCDDFNDGAAPAWAAETGSWRVQDGLYFGSGPDVASTGVCNATLMNATVREGAVARDVLVHAELTSHARADKTIVLRALDASNRVELNFRAAPLDDLIVQEVRDCEETYHTAEGEIPVPHEVGQVLDVEVELREQSLIVTVDGAVVLDREFPLSDREGQVGVAVISQGSLTSFDSIWAQQL